MGNDLSEEWQGPRSAADTPAPPPQKVAAASAPSFTAGQSSEYGRQPLNETASGVIVVRGMARGVEVRSVGTESRSEILAFRVERYDAAGNRLAPVAVELRASEVMGDVNDGDEVAVGGNWKAGTLKARTIVNVATGAQVRAVKWGDASSAAKVFGIIFLTPFAIIFTVLTVGIAPALLAIAYWRMRSRSMVCVPDLAGVGAGDADVWLRAAGLETSQQYQAPTRDGPSQPGRVIGTVPSAGTKLRPSARITVLIAS